MKSHLAVLAVLLLLLVGADGRCEAQLFKKAAERRASRQGGAASGQYQPPKKGLFGKSKEPKTGGLLNRGGGSTQRPAAGSGQNQKTGLFGKPKEPKTGGLFNKNKVDASGRPIEKPGLFGKKRQANDARYANQYTQQQRNMQASANYVQRSQRAASSEPLFRPSHSAEAAARSDKSVADASPRTDGRSDVSLLASQKPDLPSLKQAAETANGVSRQTVAGSRPKVPRRTQSIPRAAPPKKLHNTSQELPVARPTGTITVPAEVRVSADILA
ncbi:MAG: hypothetical protein NXI04_01720 [Planctomycetaceae bacterium]|nr:hypothetical protein [Planctomycetaceae bacterium]